MQESATNVRSTGARTKAFFPARTLCRAGKDSDGVRDFTFRVCSKANHTRSRLSRCQFDETIRAGLKHQEHPREYVASKEIADGRPTHPCAVSSLFSRRIFNLSHKKVEENITRLFCNTETMRLPALKIRDECCFPHSAMTVPNAACLNRRRRLRQARTPLETNSTSPQRRTNFSFLYNQVAEGRSWLYFFVDASLLFFSFIFIFLYVLKRWSSSTRHDEEQHRHKKKAWQVLYYSPVHL